MPVSRLTMGRENVIVVIVIRKRVPAILDVSGSFVVGVSVPEGRSH